LLNFAQFLFFLIKEIKKTQSGLYFFLPNSLVTMTKLWKTTRKVEEKEELKI